MLILTCTYILYITIMTVWTTHIDTDTYSNYYNDDMNNTHIYIYIQKEREGEERKVGTGVVPYKYMLQEEDSLVATSLEDVIDTTSFSQWNSGRLVSTTN